MKDLAMKVDESYFNYPYDNVFDYYVIEAWREQSERPPAYTPQMVTRHTQLLAALPWVTPTHSGNQELVLGRTPGRPRNPHFPDDPEIPPQTIYGYQIGDPGGPPPRVKMVVAAGNHGTEFTGNWMLEGMVNFLAGNDPEAILLRRTAMFYVYPDVNPEGRYQAVHQIELKAAPDPDAGTNMRHRGNPELYAAGEPDNNRVWNTIGKFAHIDTLTRAMKADTGGCVNYLWDFHGPQDKGNWRSPQGRIAWDSAYGKALCAREPEVLIAGLPGGYKSGLSFQAGKLSVWAATAEGLNAEYSYVYEPGGWTEQRLKEAGRNLALALCDILS
jgi:hypothetical protein